MQELPSTRKYIVFLTQKFKEKTHLLSQTPSDELVSLKFFYHSAQFDCQKERFLVAGYQFYLPNCQQFEPGMLLEVTGTLRDESAKSFFQQKSLEVQAVEEIKLQPSSVAFWLGRWWWLAVKLKESLLEGIELFLTQPNFTLMSGMVFGGSAQLSSELQEAFQITGLTHVVSASGYNLSVVAGLALAGLSRWTSRRASGLLAILFIWTYSLMADLTPPILRGAVMLTINLLAKRVFFRQYSLRFSLLLSAALLLLFQPFLIRSLSFWLSMLATSGIILILPRLTSLQGVFFQRSVNSLEVPAAGQGEAVKKDGFISRARAEIKESFLVTVAAQTLTLPLIALVFGQISWLSLVVNPLLLWLTPIITIWSLGLMMVVSLVNLVGRSAFTFSIFSLVGHLISWPSQLFLTAVEWFGQWQFGLIEFQ